MSQVKGSTITPRLNYFKQHDPGGAWDRLLAALNPSLADQIRAGIMAHQWYPLESYIELSHAMDKVMGKGDLKLVWELGRYSAEEALKGIYKVFYKVGSPEFIITGAATIWKQYYDTGKLSIHKDAAVGNRKHYRLWVEGFTLNDQAIWMSVGGWIERTLELSGAKQIKVEINLARLQPGVNCEYLCSWE